MEDSKKIRSKKEEVLQRIVEEVEGEKGDEDDITRIIKEEIDYFEK